jgi:hypothetical protein
VRSQQHVLFPRGMILEDDGTVRIYYGACDTVECLAGLSLDGILPIPRHENRVDTQPLRRENGGDHGVSTLGNGPLGAGPGAPGRGGGLSRRRCRENVDPCVPS